MVTDAEFSLVAAGSLLFSEEGLTCEDNRWGAKCYTVRASVCSGLHRRYTRVRQSDVAQPKLPHYGSRMPRTQSLLGDGWARALSAAMLLAIYSLIAVFCVGGQLSVFSKRVGHDALEVVHVKVDSFAGVLELGSLNRRLNQDVAELGLRHESAPDHSPILVGSGPAKDFTIEPSVEVLPISGASVRGGGWSGVSLALSRWRRTVVLLI